MKRLVHILVIALLLGPACSTEQRATGPNEKDRAEAARHESQQYQDKIEAKLRELDQEIDAPKA